MGATAYHASLPLPELLERASPNTLRCPLHAAGQVVAPLSATVTLYGPDAELLVSEAAASIVDDVATFSYTPPASLDYGEGYRVLWRLTMPDRVVSVENGGLVVRRALVCPISVGDIAAELRVVDPTGTMRLASAVDPHQVVEAAWVEIQNRLLERGRRPDLVVTPYAFRTAALERAKAALYEAAGVAMGQDHEEAARRHRRRYERAWGRVRLSYATDTSTSSSPGRVEPTLWLM